MALLKLVEKAEQDILQQYHNYLLSSDLGSSAKEYCKDIKQFMKWFPDQFSPQAVSTLDIVQYRADMQNKNLSPATINRRLNSLKSFFKYCKKNNITRDNPTEDIKLVARNEVLAPRWLDRKEQAALIRAVKEYGDLRDEAILITFLHTGLRVDELSKLKWINIQISPRSGILSVTGKGNKYREVPLNSTARKVLLEYKEKATSEYVFPGQKGAITTRAVRNVVEKYAYLSKLEDVSPHTLRHTFCKNALDLGIPLSEVATMAGHSSLDVTRIYTVPSVRDLQSSVEKMAWE